jgi:hypothetical protein
MLAYQQAVNAQARIREYMMAAIVKLPLTTANSMKLQSTSLSQLTQSTNQLTRAALVSRVYIIE